VARVVKPIPHEVWVQLARLDRHCSIGLARMRPVETNASSAQHRYWRVTIYHDETYLSDIIRGDAPSLADALEIAVTEALKRKWDGPLGTRSENWAWKSKKPT
jgi:hypothetical protein